MRAVDVIDMSNDAMPGFEKKTIRTQRGSHVRQRSFIMPANGELSRKFGVYKTLCCDAEIVIGVGVAFPDCPNHANLPTNWKELPDVDRDDYEPRSKRISEGQD